MQLVKRGSFASLLAVTVLAGCAGLASTGAPKTPSLAFDAADIALANGATIADRSHPATVMLHFAEQPFNRANLLHNAHTSITVTSQPEAFNRAEVEMTQSGFLDDSLLSRRYQATLSRNGQQWFIDAVSISRQLR
ncbi:hypothetical protein [Ferrimonas lipolytica]|uniref:Lipoprotein n=1 Tax=Ferrimonas lipolytica TaxID=2724191 RepID=A0A6H1ULR0_9GAMM|nr:hypothetical protein [Ferrimonas lipolytica]QIZ78732.1 hypothetical protein HER31_18595 [Ferrimonas lipolytica]